MSLETRKPKLAILMPMVWSLRNVLHSGLLDLLPGVDVHLLIHKYDSSLPDSSLGLGLSRVAGCHPLIPPVMKRRIKGMAFLKEVIGSAFSRRNSIGSYPIYQRWFNRNYTLKERLSRRLIEIMGYLAQPAPVFFGLYRFYNQLYQSEYDLTPVRRQLCELNPDLLLSTVNVEITYERAYILAARGLGIPVVNSVLSFDNLTSKAAHLLYDYYLVWNRRMKEQLLAFYPQVKAEDVFITGTPQFDFHLRPDCLWGREQTLERLGLPPKACYFLYGASPEGLTPAEPELVARLAEKMQRHITLKDAWLVIRPHPRDNWSRWEMVKQVAGRLVFSTAWEQPPDADGWAMLSMDDHARLTSSLAYASACINIASTISLDAAILDRPVIGIRFDREPDAPREILYEEYDTDHYSPLVKSGGLRLARTWDELLDLMQQAVEHPGQDQEARRRMVSEECGTVDGKSVQRVADALLTCLEKSRG